MLEERVDEGKKEVEGIEKWMGGVGEWVDEVKGRETRDGESKVEEMNRLEGKAEKEEEEMRSMWKMIRRIERGEDVETVG